MKYNRILVRYGEISTKGRNRKMFTAKLRENILHTLKDFPTISVAASRDRLHIQLGDENAEEIIPRLEKIFGIQSFSPVVKVPQNMEDIMKAGLALVQKSFSPGKTFKVAARRADKKFELDTNELNYEVGSYILRNMDGLKVDVKNPDIQLNVEVRKEGVYLSSEIYQGSTGMPVGASGKAMLMLSGGIDSPVAGYLTMKRGVEIEAVHFHSPPFTSERAKQKVIDLSKKLSAFSGKVKLHIVPFTKVQQTIHDQVPENYTMTSTRRMMLRIADQIREKNEGLALITGESLGQVASQTLESMQAINDVTNTPVLRPLIAMDKLEIIDIAQKIDTHDISILPYEDCCTIFTPPAPKTRPKKEKVEYYESFVDFETLLTEAVEGTETMTIDLSTGSNVENTFDELL
ncbi:tRNA 4-thiouridine(8) synthase ThiI [Rossellomorea vietnamensis]|uniref:tRNA uracil 4-sulfurtransferase ThiI n=1 Tax=Rossellomorea TaxID=2837508 RepID=UPI001CC98F94|nr:MULTISPECIES: tRNA uracil 4-sulfurtransferase ThiI [Rossellomorea]MCA0151011.1 tRNA 4-thiouridine(8) synthase ThiI [Rossellomorea vietnamensis]UTE76886.1 tRNA 4-thiouridine(8) synthase ThiI [Rossellomorea sp. KS-H15a]